MAISVRRSIPAGGGGVCCLFCWAISMAGAYQMHWLRLQGGSRGAAESSVVQTLPFKTEISAVLQPDTGYHAAETSLGQASSAKIGLTERAAGRNSRAREECLMQRSMGTAARVEDRIRCSLPSPGPYPYPVTGEPNGRQSRHPPACRPLSLCARCRQLELHGTPLVMPAASAEVELVPEDGSKALRRSRTGCLTW